ncbi:MAG: LacI family DNA-binding transcriptional regulator [Verrucomicrobiota bacterium]
MISQKNLAKKLGISRSAVSAVLNPDSKIVISPKTRRLVLEAAEKMGYRPNRFAQILVSGKSRIIGVVSHIKTLHVGIERHQAVVQKIREAGYQPLVGEFREDNPQMICQSMLDAQVEGILMVNICMNSPKVEAFREVKIPMVSLTNHSDPKIPHVQANAYQGMKNLTRYILGQGYRNLMLVVPKNASSGTIEDRVRGFQEALQEKEVKLDPSFVWQEELSKAEDLLNPHFQGWDATRKILQQKNRPEVLLFTNDDWAIGGLRAIFEAGLRVPEDIAVTGFDNTPGGEYTFSPLTTVKQPTQAMATLAVDFLFDLIQGKKLTKDQYLTELPCELVIRCSCGTDFKNRK